MLEMTETEVQELFEQFAAPILQQESAQQHAENAAILAKHLWLALIGGPELETGVWKTFKEQPGVTAQDAEAVRQCYFDEMKPAVSRDELKALRQRYGLHPKRPASSRILNIREQIFEDIHIPAWRRPAGAGMLPTAILWAVCGSLYGSAVGAVLASTEFARMAVLIGGTLMAVAGLAAGVWYGRIFGAVNRMAFGRLFGGCVGAVFGGLGGIFLGVMLVAVFGTLPGAIVGVLLGRFLVPGRRTIGPALGIFVGAGSGALVIAFQWDRELATAGAIWGASMGFVGGGLLLLVLIGLLNLLRTLPTRR